MKTNHSKSMSHTMNKFLPLVIHIDHFCDPVLLIFDFWEGWEELKHSIKNSGLAIMFW